MSSQRIPKTNNPPATSASVTNLLRAKKTQATHEEKCLVRIALYLCNAKLDCTKQVLTWLIETTQPFEEKEVSGKPGNWFRLNKRDISDERKGRARQLLELCKRISEEIGLLKGCYARDNKEKSKAKHLENPALFAMYLFQTAAVGKEKIAGQDVRDMLSEVQFWFETVKKWEKLEGLCKWIKPTPLRIEPKIFQDYENELDARNIKFEILGFNNARLLGPLDGENREYFRAKYGGGTDLEKYHSLVKKGEKLARQCKETESDEMGQIIESYLFGDVTANIIMWDDVHETLKEIILWIASTRWSGSMHADPDETIASINDPNKDATKMIHETIELEKFLYHEDRWEFIKQALIWGSDKTEHKGYSVERLCTQGSGLAKKYTEKVHSIGRYFEDTGEILKSCLRYRDYYINGTDMKVTMRIVEDFVDEKRKLKQTVPDFLDSLKKIE
ncbi:hypothetical protein NHQ30_009372 [Ciborinia camelliae]|nr:hypothetical protein NHQ30_009372 [Ciborinia camelliae]